MNNLPFYVSYESYIQFIMNNLPRLELSDDALFIGYLFVQLFFIFCIYLLVKLLKFIILYIGNNIL